MQEQGILFFEGKQEKKIWVRAFLIRNKSTDINRKWIQNIIWKQLEETPQ